MKAIRHFAILAFISITSSLASRAYDVPSCLVENLDEDHLTPIEGIWLWNSGALVEIKANNEGKITITLVESADPTVDTPVTIGWGRFGSRSGTYDVEMIATRDAAKLKNSGKKAHYILKFEKNGHLSIEPYNTGLKVNAWRLLPYLFRFSVTESAPAKDISGAVKVWPVTPTSEFPVIL